jgi:hypothetical protein
MPPLWRPRHRSTPAGRSPPQRAPNLAHRRLRGRAAPRGARRSGRCSSVRPCPARFTRAVCAIAGWADIFGLAARQLASQERQLVGECLLCEGPIALGTTHGAGQGACEGVHQRERGGSRGGCAAAADSRAHDPDAVDAPRRFQAPCLGPGRPRSERLCHHASSRRAPSDVPPRPRFAGCVNWPRPPTPH